MKQTDVYPPQKLSDIKISSYYKGDGEHSISDLECLIKERNEEIHRLRLLIQRLESK